MYITTARSTAKIVVVRRALVGTEDTLDPVCGDVAMRIPVRRSGAHFTPDPSRPNSQVAAEQA
jgi:hypothetical protein